MDVLKDHTSIIIPDAQSSQTEVSVAYVHDPHKQWFVLRVSYGREDLVADELIRLGCYAYIAKREQWKMVNGKRQKFIENMIPNILFSYLTPQEAEMYVRDVCPAGTKNPCPKLSAITSYYYNHFATAPGGKNPPLVIPHRQMQTFIKATCTRNEHLVALQKDDYHFLMDEEVEVIGGPFEGIRGRVIRAGGQQRILIRLTTDEGNVLGEFGTAFIPKSLMKKVE